MNTFTLLALLSVVGASALFIALALFLFAISRQLEMIGGEEHAYGVRSSFLSKIRFGVRAIEVETGVIAPQVTRLNETLTNIRDGLVAINNNLAGVIDGVTKQESR